MRMCKSLYNNFVWGQKNWVFFHCLLICSTESLLLDDDNIRNVLNYAHDNLPNLQVLIDGDPSFAWTVPPLPPSYVQPEWLGKFVDHLQDVEFERRKLGDHIRNYAKKEKISFTKLMKIMRLLLSGKADGYQVPEMMHILGRDNTTKRLLRVNDVNSQKISQSI